MSTSSVALKRSRMTRPSDGPSASPPIQIWRKCAALLTRAMALSCRVSENSTRIIVGTMPTRVMR